MPLFLLGKRGVRGNNVEPQQFAGLMAGLEVVACM